MDGVLDFIERHKYGITFAILIHLAVFVGLNLYYVSNPVEMPERKMRTQIESDDYEIEMTPEELEALYANQPTGEEAKNIVGNANDDRESSYEDYSKFSTSDGAKSAKDYEKQAFEEAKAEREAKGDLMKDFNSDVKIYGGDEGKEKSTNASTSKNKYAGKTVLNYDLKGRTPKDNNDWNVRNPGYRCKGSGTVVVIIKVDRYGNVKEAKLDAASSRGYSECMVNNAIKYAKLSLFNYKDSAPAMQTGRITYNFIAQ